MYYLLYPILYLISLLPLRILYWVSDGLYVVVYYLIGYRKEVVLKNLNIAFPEKSEKEKIRIAKDFYHNLIDSMLESLKLLSAPISFFEKRVTGNWEVANKYFTTGRSLQLHSGHFFNWEWLNPILPAKLKYLMLVVYMPISTAWLNRIYLKMRSRYGTIMISAHNMVKEFIPYRKSQYCMGLVADQNPGTQFHKARWFHFFNRVTAFTIGPGKNAVNNNTVIVFISMKKTRRGHYHVNFELAEEFPQTKTENELTQKYVQYLEAEIKKNPEMWLWSHRRWKHEWKEDQGYEMGEI